MLILGNIISKVLVLTEYVLDYFVVLTPLGYDIGNAECGFTCAAVNGQMTPCGSTMIDNVMGLAFGLVELAPSLLCGLFVLE